MLPLMPLFSFTPDRHIISEANLTITILSFCSPSSPSLVHPHLRFIDTWTLQHGPLGNYSLWLIDIRSLLCAGHTALFHFRTLAFGFDFFVTPPKFYLKSAPVKTLWVTILALPRLFPGLGSTRFCDRVSITTIVATTAPTTLTLDMG